MALYQAFLKTDEEEPSFLQFASSNSESAKALIRLELPQATLLCLEQYEAGQWRTLEGERPTYAIPLVLPSGHRFQVANVPVDTHSGILPTDENTTTSGTTDPSHSASGMPEPRGDARPPAIVMVLRLMGWLTIIAGLLSGFYAMESLNDATLAIAWLFGGAVSGTLILAMGAIIQNLWNLNRTLGMATGLRQAKN